MTTDLEIPSSTPTLDELDAASREFQVTAHLNPAVAHCAYAYMLHYRKARARGDSDADAKSWSRRAYRLSLPALTGSRNVRDFIACVTHGMLLGVIDPDEASKFLYAAQVAHTARRPKYKPRITVQEQVSQSKKQLSKRQSDT